MSHFFLLPGQLFIPSCCSMNIHKNKTFLQGVIPGGGAGGGPTAPPNFWPKTLFSGFSHTTDRKVPSEVVLMGSFMSVIYGNVR